MINIPLLAKSIGLQPRTICEIGVNAPDKCSIAELMPDAEKTILVEPLPWLAEKLRKTFPQAIVHEMAIGESPVIGKLYDRGEGSWIDQVPQGGAPDEHPQHSHMQRGEFDQQFVREIRIETMQAIDDGKIDVLCIDTEGAEWLAIKHMQSRPAILRAETHFSHSGYRNPFYDEIFNWTAAHGYQQLIQDVSDTLWIKIC